MVLEKEHSPKDPNIVECQVDGCLDALLTTRSDVDLAELIVRAP